MCVGGRPAASRQSRVNRARQTTCDWRITIWWIMRVACALTVLDRPDSSRQCAVMLIIFNFLSLWQLEFTSNVDCTYVFLSDHYNSMSIKRDCMIVRGMIGIYVLILVVKRIIYFEMSLLGAFKANNTFFPNNNTFSHILLFIKISCRTSKKVHYCSYNS